MKDLDYFLPKVRARATGVAEPVALDAIRDAAAEFCRRTRLWRFSDQFDVTASKACIAVPFGATLLDIERVNFNGCRLDPQSTQWLDDHIEQWRDAPVSGMPKWFTQTSMNSILIVPAQAGTVKLWVTLSVGQDAEQVPDFMADQYREAIANGALWRLLMLPGKTFTNPNLAATAKAQFDEVIDSLKSMNASGQQRAVTGSRASFL